MGGMFIDLNEHILCFLLPRRELDPITQISKDQFFLTGAHCRILFYSGESCGFLNQKLSMIQVYTLQTKEIVTKSRCKRHPLT